MNECATQRLAERTREIQLGAAHQLARHYHKSSYFNHPVASVLPPPLKNVKEKLSQCRYTRAFPASGSSFEHILSKDWASHHTKKKLNQKIKRSWYPPSPGLHERRLTDWVKLTIPILLLDVGDCAFLSPRMEAISLDLHLSWKGELAKPLSYLDGMQVIVDGTRQVICRLGETSKHRCRWIATNFAILIARNLGRS